MTAMGQRPAVETVIPYEFDVDRVASFWLPTFLLTGATASLFLPHAASPDATDWSYYVFLGVVLLSAQVSIGVAKVRGRLGHRGLLAWGRTIVFLQWIATAGVAYQGLLAQYFFFVFSVLMMSMQLYWSAGLIALPRLDYVRLTDVLRATIFLWTVILLIVCAAVGGRIVGFPAAAQFLNSDAPTWAALVAVGYMATAIPGQGYREYQEGRRVLQDLTAKAKAAEIAAKKAEFADLRELYQSGELSEAEFNQARAVALEPLLLAYVDGHRDGIIDAAQLEFARTSTLAFYDPET